MTTIGERTPLIDGPDKVAGKAAYTADLALGDSLAGRILRSAVSHAELISVDTTAALALPGVRAVITGAECDVPFGVLPIAQNEFPIARDRVRYRGEPIAAVAAIDERTAAEALALITVELRELPAYDDVGAARAQGATVLHAERPGNIEREASFELGDTAAGFAAAVLVREETFENAEVNQVHMEPNATLAAWDAERERLTVHTCTQVPFYVHLMIGRCLGLDEANIRVVKPHVGGGFGARTETLGFEIIAALLARASEGRVRLVLSREETFLCHRGRPQTTTRMKIGLDADGKITAVECETVQRGGAYSGYGIVSILYAGSLLYALYDMPAAKYQGLRVLTNTPPCGAMRGHGTVNVRFAFETLLDAMAEDMGLDPFAVRRANLLSKLGLTDNDLLVASYGLPQCLDWVEKASGWRDKHGKLAPGRGIGMACSHYVSGAAKPVHWTGEPHATVHVKLDWDGAVTVLTGAAEIGQGSSTMVAQCVAEVLALDMSRLRIVAADSAVTPKDNGSYSSRVTFMVGNAAIDAAKNLRAILVEAAAKQLEAAPEEIECLGETYRVAGSQDPGLAYREIVKAALAEHGTITVTGNFSTPKEAQGGKKYRGAAIGSTMGFSYAAQAVEVSVDPVTAQVTVEKVWVAHDCGRALNPLAVEGQVQGSVWMGMGQALSEENQYIQGLPVHANLIDYRVPTIVESPDIEVEIIESIDPNGPFGAKEAGEGSLSGFLPALASAIDDAVGYRPTECPMTPDRIFTALAKQARSAAAEAAE
ncbi:MAG: 4-hydroxybenzoyl-CoA reductase subunit alpha [Alphaproteobacteria bacterium]